MPSIIVSFEKNDYDKVATLLKCIKEQKMSVKLRPYHGNSNVETDNDLTMENMLLKMIKLNMFDKNNVTNEVLNEARSLQYSLENGLIDENACIIDGKKELRNNLEVVNNFLQLFD